MLKAIGTLFGASMAVTAGSYLIIPVIVVSILFTVGDSIGKWWPYLLGLLGYTMVTGFLIKVVPIVFLKALIVLAAGLVPPVYIWVTYGQDWTAGIVGSLMAAAVLGTGLMALSESGAKARGRQGGSLDTAYFIGRIALIQTFWLAPAAVMFLSGPTAMSIIATLLGAIAMLFAAE